MTSAATSVTDYLDQLPPDRQAAIKAVRAVIRKNLPKGFAEQMQYGMITYVVPHKLYPAGYHCNPKDPLPFASLASQKNHMALYLQTVYQSPAVIARSGALAEGAVCVARQKARHGQELRPLQKARGPAPERDR